jgi:hypothetical protein
MKMTFDENLSPVFEGADDSGDKSAGSSLELAQRGLFGGFGGMRFGGIPVGEALVGGASATLVSELISGTIGTGVMGALVKLVAGNMLAGVFSGVMGKGATDSAQLFLTYDAIRDLVPIDQWVSQLLGGVTGGVGQSQGVTAQVPYTGNGNVVAIDEWLKSAA